MSTQKLPSKYQVEEIVSVIIGNTKMPNCKVTKVHFGKNWNITNGYTESYDLEYQYGEKIGDNFLPTIGQPLMATRFYNVKSDFVCINDEVDHYGNIMQIYGFIDTYNFINKTDITLIVHNDYIQFERELSKEKQFKLNQNEYNNNNKEKIEKSQQIMRFDLERYDHKRRIETLIEVVQSHYWS